MDTRAINRPELSTSKLVIIHDLPDRLDNPVDSDAICKTQARPPIYRDKGELAIRSSELPPLQPGVAAADRTDPPDRRVRSVESKALCSTGSYARPPVERDKSDSGLVDAERFQALLIFTADASVVSQDLLVLKLALDHTFGSQGRPPVERDKTELTIWKGDDRETCFFEENGATFGCNTRRGRHSI